MSTPDLVETGDTLVIGKARGDLAIEAACEIEELCNVLRAAVVADGGYGMLALRGMTVRVRDLARVVISALSDGNDDTADIAQRAHIDLPAQEGAA